MLCHTLIEGDQTACWVAISKPKLVATGAIRAGARVGETDADIRPEFRQVRGNGEGHQHTLQVCRDHPGKHGRGGQKTFLSLPSLSMSRWCIAISDDSRAH